MNKSRIRKSLAAIAMAAASLTATVALASPAHAQDVRHTAIQFSKTSKLVLTVDANPVSGSPVRTAGYLGSTTQRWVLPNNSSVPSEYRLARLIRSGNQFVPGCLDLPTSGAQLVIRPCNGAVSQKWVRSGFDNGNPTTAITRNAQNGKVLQEQFSFPSAAIAATQTGANNQRAGFIDIKLV